MRYLVWMRGGNDAAHAVYERIGATEHMIDATWPRNRLDVRLNSAFVESDLSKPELIALINSTIYAIEASGGAPAALDTIWSPDDYRGRADRRTIHFNGVMYTGEVPQEDLARLTEGQEDVLA